jgi:hypothetical protein
MWKVLFAPAGRTGREKIKLTMAVNTATVCEDAAIAFGSVKRFA